MKLGHQSWLVYTPKQAPVSPPKVISVSDVDSLHICNCHQGGSDALVSLPEENQTSPRTEMSVTSNANTVCIKTWTRMFGLIPPAVDSLNFPVQDLETYPMTTLPRGCCLIINNYNFGESSLGKREGTKVDEGKPRSPGLMEDRKIWSIQHVNKSDFYLLSLRHSWL